MSDFMLLLHHSVWCTLSKCTSSWSRVQGSGSPAGWWVQSRSHRGARFYLAKPCFLTFRLWGIFFVFFSSVGSALVNFCPDSQFSSSRQKSMKLRNTDNMEHTGKCPGYRRPVMLGHVVFPTGPWIIQLEVCGREGKPLAQRDLSDVGVTNVSRFSSE